MNTYLIKLALLGSKGSIGRWIGIAVGLTAGTAMLLLLVAVHAAIDKRAARSGWIEAVTVPSVADAFSTKAVDPTSELIVARVPDRFGSQTIVRLDVAVTASDVEIPGIPVAPREGTYYASAELQSLIESQPIDALGGRYGAFVGRIDPEVLGAPDALVVLVGQTPATVTERAGAQALDGWPRPREGAPDAYQTILLLGAVGMIFPVLLFVLIVTRLGAAQRQERLATLSLLGAPRWKTAMLPGIEMAALSVIGCSFGAALYFVLTPVVARFQIGGGRFHLHDLLLAPGLVAAIAGGGVLLAVGTAMVGAIGTTPVLTGQSQHLREQPPGWWRLMPLTAGIAFLIAPSLLPNDDLAATEPLLLIGFLLVPIGIATLGALLTYAFAGFVLDRTGSAAGIIAASRMRAFPRAVSRSVSGLVIAIFLVSVFAGASSGIGDLLEVSEHPDRLPADALFQVLGYDRIDLVDLRNDPDVSAVFEIHALRHATQFEADEIPVAVSISDYDGLNRAWGTDGDVVTFDLSRYLEAGTDTNLIVEAYEGAPLGEPHALIVATRNGSAGLDRVRTRLQSDSAPVLGPLTRTDLADSSNRGLVEELTRLAYAGTFVTILIAGVSLAVSTIVAILDRARTFGLMRVMGMPGDVLRRVVIFEAALPIASVVLLAAVLGFLTAWLIVRNLTSGIGITIPEPGYFVAIGSGLAMAGFAVWASLNTIGRSAAMERPRFE